MDKLNTDVHCHESKIDSGVMSSRTDEPVLFGEVHRTIPGMESDSTDFGNVGNFGENFGNPWQGERSFIWCGDEIARNFGGVGVSVMEGMRQRMSVRYVRFFWFFFRVLMTR